jgi:DNA polymerase-4
MKVACLLALHLPVQVERHHNPSLVNGPLVVGGRPWDPGAVLDRCPQAAAAGVKPGMRLSRAETLCLVACFVPAREDLYHATHDLLVEATRTFTPSVGTSRLGLLYAEVAGLERCFGPDARLARQMALETRRFSRLDVRIGVEGGKFVAEQAARAALPDDECTVPRGEERAFLSALPLSVLPADPEMRQLQAVSRFLCKMPFTCIA